MDALPDKGDATEKRDVGSKATHTAIGHGSATGYGGLPFITLWPPHKVGHVQRHILFYAGLEALRVSIRWRV